MKKAALLPLLTLLLVSCGETSSSLSRITRSSEESSAPSSSEIVSSSEATSVFVPPTSDDFISRYFDKTASFRTYKAVTKGSTKAKVLFIETEQSIDVTVIKNEYSYLINESHSSLVNTVHQAYFHNDKVAYRNDDKGYTVSDLKTYLDAYGVYPLDPTIEGYLCDKECVKSVEPITASEGYAFKISFDPEKATTNVRIQMKAFGGLDDYPVFSNIEVSVYTKGDLTPDHLDVVADYDAKKMVDTSCHQEYRVDFSNFNEDIAVPDLETIKSEYKI